MNSPLAQPLPDPMTRRFQGQPRALSFRELYGYDELIAGATQPRHADSADEA